MMSVVITTVTISNSTPFVGDWKGLAEKLELVS